MADGKRTPKAPGQAAGRVKSPNKTVDNRDAKGRFGIGNNASPGRPRLGNALTDILRQELAKTIDGKEGSPTKAQVMAQVLAGKALEGDLTALKMVYERLEGRPAETLSISGDMQYTEIEQQESVLIQALKEEQPALWGAWKKRLITARLEGNGSGDTH